MEHRAYATIRRMRHRHATAPTLEHFLCSYDELLARIDAIDPEQYDQTRNDLDGAVTWLSPFLTHGIISTRTIAERVLEQHAPERCYRLLFELAWREYFHRCWQELGDTIFEDVRHPQSSVESTRLPTAIVDAATGIHSVDTCLDHLLTHGTLHNHARLWIAAMTCNLAHTAWFEPARWLHYHLLDGDLASNTLSWQWVAGTFSHRRYLAGQANVNKYSRMQQHASWLDQSCEALESMPTPEVLRSRCDPALPCRAPGVAPSTPIVSSTAITRAPLHLRSLWDLDPFSPGADAPCSTADAHARAENASRASLPPHRQSLVFVDVERDAEWPMSETRWRFIEHWASACDASIVTGTLDALLAATEGRDVSRREYPACKDWPGVPLERDWLYGVPQRPWRSFSQFWKQVCGNVGLNHRQP